MSSTDVDTATASDTPDLGAVDMKLRGRHVARLRC